MAISKYSRMPEIEVHTVEDAFLAVKNAMSNKMHNDPDELLPRAWLGEEDIYKVINDEQQKYRERMEEEKREKNSDICDRNDSLCVCDMVHMRNTSECEAAASGLHTAV